VGDPGNPDWAGGGDNDNRGGVDYEFKIGRFEVNTAQWVEFMNAAFDRPANDLIPFVHAPSAWSATRITPQNGGTRRWAVPTGGDMNAVGGVNWRVSAIYCNWLHNGKGTDRAAFLDGAYDVSTFGSYLGGDTYTDQLAHHPAARYWIPTLDEWIKAAHWDPNKNGPGEGGYWTWANSSDQPPRYGPPGQLVNGLPTTANGGWTPSTWPGFDPFAIPLNAYPTALSPWGLADTAGATSEWTEAAGISPGEMFLRDRYSEGSAWALGAFSSDHVQSPLNGIFPMWSLYDVGLRVAAAVPAPGPLSGLAIVATFTFSRQRRRADRLTTRPCYVV